MATIRNVAVLPTSSELINNRLFEIKFGRDNNLEKYMVLKQLLKRNNYSCQTTDQIDPEKIDILIFSRLDLQLKKIIDIIKNNSKVKLLYWANEEPIITSLHEPKILSALPVDIIFTWQDAIKNNNNIIKCNIGQPFIKCDFIPNYPFEYKKFICLISGNKKSNHPNELYTKRIEIAKYFSKKNEGFDLYGTGWEYSHDDVIKKMNKGPIIRKKDILQQYKYSLCFENSYGYPGDITEKIFDCFAAGTVPIYLGAPNINDYIPNNCFIDFRKLKNSEDLYKFLKSIDEKTYVSFLENTKLFLNSTKYYKFTSAHVAKLITEQILGMENRSTNNNLIKIKIELTKIIVRNIPILLKNYFNLPKKFLFDLITAW